MKPLLLASFAIAGCSMGTPRTVPTPVQTAPHLGEVARLFVDRGGATESDIWWVTVTKPDGVAIEVLQGRQGDAPKLKWLADGRLVIQDPPPMIDQFTNFVEHFGEDGNDKRTEILLWGSGHRLGK